MILLEVGTHFFNLAVLLWHLQRLGVEVQIVESCIGEATYIIIITMNLWVLL
jgi:hypothetical protein